MIADLAVTLALGGDCLADIALLRAEPGLFGPVASDPVVSRLVAKLAKDAPRALKAIRAARAAARHRAWELAGDGAPGAHGALVTVDLDATIVISHSEKDQAAPTWKKTFGLLTELAKASFLFSQQVVSAFITVPAHGRWRAFSGYGGTGGPRWRAGSGRQEIPGCRSSWSTRMAAWWPRLPRI